MSQTKAAPAASRPAPSEQAPIVFWQNRAARFLDVGGQTVSVSDDMATIMDALLEVPGRVVSTDYLLYLLYDDQRKPEPENAKEALRVKIYALRQTGIHIHNVKDAGYFLGQPRSDLETGKTYIGKDEVGRWQVVRVYREPVAVMHNVDDNEIVHVTLASLRLWGLKEEKKGPDEPAQSRNESSALTLGLDLPTSATMDALEGCLW